MSSEVEATPTTTSTVPGSTGVESDKSVHDSEEYESAEEIEGEEYEDELGAEEEELEEIEVEVEEEVDDDENSENDEGEKDVNKLEKPLDDDQDRKNPQFIPKKGYFYEHDDRTGADEVEENEEEPKTEPEKPKKIVKEASDRWSHDLYDESEQTPKSNDELRTRYGYDIRTEDTAPRARRHKRYSRGPTTYTRKWEDEEAYQRPRGGFRGRGRGGFQKPLRRDSRNYDEEFPDLQEKHSGPKPKVAEREKQDKTIEREKQEKIEEKQPIKTKSHDSGVERQVNNKEVSQRKHDERNRRIPEESVRGRGNKRIFHGSKQFTNSNRYPERRHEEFNRNKDNYSEDQKAWEQKVDRLREAEKSKSPKQANGSTGLSDSKSHKQSPVTIASSSTSAPKSTNDNQIRKSVQPFTNTEYTGSASLTAKRSQQSSHTKAAQIQTNLAEKERANENDQDTRSEERGGNRAMTNSSYTSEKNRTSDVAPRSQQSTSSQPVSESSKPKRFSSQRQRQNQEGVAVTVAPTSSTPPANVGPVNSGPQVHLGGQTNLTLVTATGQIISPGVPVSVMSGYPPGPGYYEQVQTAYDPQGYETSGSPITVVPGPAGSSVSPSLWTPHQHPAYAGPPYPSPPTGPPQMQQPYDAPAYLTGQPQQIFAPPPHGHPQFIQDPTIINYAPPGPPPSFAGPPFHPQQFPGYPQVPPGPPEMYHSGMTYYSPQTQMQRPPPQHIIVQTQSKRTGSRLQLVEPSRPSRPRAYQGREEAEAEMYQLQQHYPTGAFIETGQRLGGEMETYDQAKETLSDKLQDTLSVNPESERRKKSPSPAPLEISNPPESESWADQVSEMTPINSPVKPEASVDFSNGKAASESSEKEK